MTGTTEVQPRPNSQVALIGLFYVIYLYMYFMVKKMMLRVMFLFPSVSERLLERIGKVTHMDETPLTTEDWGQTITSWECLKSEVKMYLMDRRKIAKPDDDAINVDIARLDGSPAKLFDFVSDASRPLIVNFGSCT